MLLGMSINCAQYLSRYDTSVFASIALPFCVFRLSFHDAVLLLVALYFSFKNSLYIDLSEASTGAPRYILLRTAEGEDSAAV